MSSYLVIWSQLLVEVGKGEKGDVCGGWKEYIHIGI